MSSKTQTTTNIEVLVHGSWHTGEAWAGVRAGLEARGHRVFTPDLAGRDPGSDRARVRFNDHVAAVVSEILLHDLHNVSLVGHSMAGPIICKVAEQVPDRLAQLLFFDAIVLQDGQSYADMMPALAEQLRPLAEAEPDYSLPAFWEFFQALWADPLAGASPLASLERAREIFAHHLVREPMAPMFEPIDLSHFFHLNVPTCFILARQDTLAYGEGYWREMAAKLACPVIEMDGGHESLYTRPADVVTALLEASQRSMPRAA